MRREEIILNSQQLRRRKVLYEAVRRGGTLRSQDAPDEEYATGQQRFRDDGRQLNGKTALAREMMSPLALPLPVVSYEKGQLQVPVREFARKRAKADSESREEFLDAVLNHQLADDDALIPRGGSLFLGFGTTVYDIALMLLDRDAEFLGDIQTTSFEIAGFFYYLNRRRRICLPGCEIDWENGALVPSEGTAIDTTIVSVDTIDAAGILYSENTRALGLTNHAISHARRRVLIIADHTKIGRPLSGGGEIDLSQVKDSAKVWLVTDRELPEEFKAPENLEVVVV